MGRAAWVHHDAGGRQRLQQQPRAPGMIQMYVGDEHVFDGLRPDL